MRRVEGEAFDMRKDSRMTRRQVLRIAGGVGVSAAGVAALAACGEAEPQIITKEVPVEKIVVKEVPVEKIVRETEVREVPVERVVTQEKVVTQQVEVPVERVVTQIVEREKVVEKVVTREVQVMVEAQPEQRTVKIEFATDHTSGPRGKAMSWAIERFAVERPDIKIKFIPQNHIFYEKIAIEAAAGTLSEVNLLNGGTYQRHIEGESWLLINDLLDKRDDHDPDNYWFIPDSYSDNKDESYPYDRTMHGPQHGMPFQTVIGGMLYNIDALAAAGVDEPMEGWRYDDLLEAAKRVTDPDTGIYGLNADRSEQFYVFPAAFGYNDQAERPRGSDGAQVWGPALGDGPQGWKWIVDLIYEHGVAFTPEQRPDVAGEFGSPFAAGNQVFWIGGRVYSTGFAIPRIRDRFRWSLGPMVWGNVTDHANFVLNDQAHLVAQSATTTGVEEQAVAWAHFLAGPQVQGRVGIDRGHMPCFKAVADDAAATAPPPEGMHHLFTYPESPYVRHDQWYVPGGNFLELRAEWRPVLDKALVGEADPVQSMLDAAEKVNRMLARWQEQLDKGDVAR